MCTNTFTVTEMTCGRCVRRVRSTIEEIAGVTDVDVHLSSGTVTVRSTEALDHGEVAAALEGAGYQVES